MRNGLAFFACIALAANAAAAQNAPARLTASDTYNWRSVAEVTLQVPGSGGTWCGARGSASRAVMTTSNSVSCRW